MGRREHAVTRAILDAVETIERYEGEVTPETVRANVEIKWSDWPPEVALDEALRARIQRVLRGNGYVIADQERGVRKDFWQATTADLEEQYEVKKLSSHYDRKRMAADEAVITFLKAKEQELGYEVCPDLFHGEIDRIYSMYEVSVPGGG